ncbi:hypothetical protein [Prosthecobacter sp.]|uniref:hypothetical protein n=1 Tax=Prosthecobacter sp. TaxID=1965333 RepID=UPI002ABBA4BF|nr:hypothetical protein [Prosthecobacter sp.]MDZ4403555.1 hypothetical protein [Prosthecobacter sp.]
MIDRVERDRMIVVIEGYLDDRITAFEFDKQLCPASNNDQMAAEIARLAWFHYDDCKDHHVVMTKEQWNLFQRFILLLKSDLEALPELPISTVKRWGWDHGLALVVCLLFVALACWVGWGPLLFLLALPFGVVSLMIDRYRTGLEPVSNQRDPAFFPLNNFVQLSQLRRRTMDFEKRQYRQEISTRRIRDEAEQQLNCFMGYVFRLLFGPLMLLGQAFPSTSIAAPVSESEGQKNARQRELPGDGKRE